MERKIGEIFEYNGEWYQCVKGLYCDNCAFVNDNCEDRERITLREKLTKQPTTGFCNSEKRNDRKSVIFKKLEKVGGTYAHNSVIVQKYRIRTAPVIMPNEPYMYFNAIDNTIEIEIKQNKEDMEEKKQKLDDLVGLYTSAKITYKEFDLEAAKAGKPVCTRAGRKARIICFDAINEDKCPIIALARNGQNDYAFYCDNEGKSKLSKDLDLMMLPEKKEGWVKIRKDINLYNTKEDADRKMIGNDEYVTAKVCLEE